MKIKAKDIVILGALIALAPAVALAFPRAEGDAAPQPDAPAAPASAAILGQPTEEEAVRYTIYDEATGKPFTVSEREYIIAAVMSELPCDYALETIKAQAVATRTYARYVQALRETDPLPELQGASFSVNTDTHLGYMTEARGKVFFGSEYSAYRALVEQAVDETAGILLLYDGEPIAACYHAISPGETENAENVFSTPLPYLVSVDSAADVEAEGYHSQKRFTPDDLAGLLKQYDSDFSTSGEPSSWLGASAVTASGTVRQQVVCGKSYTGTALREALSLRSAAFSVTYSQGEFVFDVMGYGHGVGLSQNGANAMALAGSGFVEILEHYYPGAVCVNTAV